MEYLHNSVDILEGHAKAIVHNLYLRNKLDSENVLFRKIKRFGNQTAFDLACMADARSFLSDKACTAAIYNSWWGDLSTVPGWKIILYLLLPCLSCCRPTTKNPTDCFGSLSSFYQIPAIKCTFHFFAFVLFLLIYSYVLLTGLDGSPSIAEYLILSWMVTLLVEECRQMNQIFHSSSQLTVEDKFGQYFSQFWNILDLVGIICYVVGMILRVTAYFYDDNTLLMIGQAVLAVDIIVLYVRSLQFFSMHEKIGPLFIMVRYMFEDMANFIVIAVVVLVGYGVALHSVLYPFSQLNLSLLDGILNLPYFQIYGELAVDTILEASANETDPSVTIPGFRNYFGLFLGGIFLLFVNILLLNLLIALFNSSYNRVEADSAFHNVLHQVDFLREYQSRSLLPPPLVLIEYLLIIPIRKCRDSIKKHKQVSHNADNKGEVNKDNFATNLQHVIDAHFAKQENTEDNRTENNFKELKNLCEALMKKLDMQAQELKELRTDVNTHIKRKKKHRAKRKHDSEHSQ